MAGSKVHLISFGLSLTALVMLIAVASSPNRKTLLASGKMAHLTMVGGTGGDTRGYSNLGALNERGVDFYVEGICVHGSGLTPSKLCDGKNKCGTTLPSATGTEACWMRYTELKQVDKCTEVKLSAKPNVQGSLVAIDATQGGNKPTIKATNVGIDRLATAIDGFQCMLAGCDYDQVAHDAIDNEGACKAYATKATKTPVVDGSSVLTNGLQKGFIFEQSPTVKYSLNVLKAEEGGTTDTSTTRLQAAKNVFGLHDYPVKMKKADAIGNFTVLLWFCTAPMFIVSILVLTNVMNYTQGKYTKALNKNTPQGNWLLSTVLDIVHLIFFIILMVYFAPSGRMFGGALIEHTLGDNRLPLVYWLVPNFIWLPLLYVGLHGCIYLFRQRNGKPGNLLVIKGNTWMNNPKTNKMGDENLEQRASMVRNNLNV